jgi:hypothetical protein
MNFAQAGETGVASHADGASNNVQQALAGARHSADHVRRNI